MIISPEAALLTASCIESDGLTRCSSAAPIPEHKVNMVKAISIVVINFFILILQNKNKIQGLLGLTTKHQEISEKGLKYVNK
jgi:hypothetical protein